MAIRLRTADGIRVALCAVEADAMPGDVYLDDADHYALATKFALDGIKPEYADPRLVAAMAKQKLRDAHEVHTAWELAGRSLAEAGEAGGE